LSYVWFFAAACREPKDGEQIQSPDGDDRKQVCIPVTGIIRFLAIAAPAGAFHFLSYFGCELLEKNPHTVGWKIDEKIPLLPGFIYIYISWIPMLALTPLLLFYFSDAVFIRYIIAWILDLILSCMIFLAYPTTFVHPKPSQKGLTGFVFKLVYSGSFRYLNSAPSLHCSMALLYIFSVCACPGLPLILKVILSAYSLLIICSTLFVKQHVLVDVVTAAPVAVICWAASMWISQLFY